MNAQLEAKTQALVEEAEQVLVSIGWLWLSFVFNLLFYYLKRNQDRLLSAGNNHDRTYSLLDQVDTDDQLFRLGNWNIYLYDFHSWSFICRDMQTASLRPNDVKVGIEFLIVKTLLCIVFFFKKGPPPSQQPQNLSARNRKPSIT